MKTSHCSRCRRAFTLVEIMIVVVIVGMLAAFAIPQFLKIRTRSQDSAVTNNLRQIAQASSQYFLEKGVTTVALTDLIGSDKYIKNFSVLAAETYPTVITQGQAIVATGVGGDRTLSFDP